MASTASDPRDASLEAKFTLPNTWYKEATDGLGTSGMMLNGLIMVTRNRFLAWPSVLLGVNSYINSHPMRSKEGGAGISNIALCLMALVASYIPHFLLTPSPSATSVPLATTA